MLWAALTRLWTIVFSGRFAELNLNSVTSAMREVASLCIYGLRLVFQSTPVTVCRLYTCHYFSVKFTVISRWISQRISCLRVRTAPVVLLFLTPISCLGQITNASADQAPPVHLVHRSILGLSLCFASSHLGFPQTPTPSTFQAQAQTASSGKAFSKVNLTANAEWVEGSLHESGTAQLTAGADGSTSFNLPSGKRAAQRRRPKLITPARSWVAVAGKRHVIHGPNCFVAISWFAPSLLVQPANLRALLATTDDGAVEKDKVNLLQVSQLQGKCNP
jgi:hypothetical protein